MPTSGHFQAFDAVISLDLDFRQGASFLRVTFCHFLHCKVLHFIK